MRTISDQLFKAKSPFRSEFVSNRRFLNCSFENCNFSEYRFTNCHFEDCVFRDCNFNHAFLALNLGYNSGSFIRCLFDQCKLKDTSFRFPIIDHCEFRNCVLNETNFDGSRFSNTRFIGKLDSCWFSGYSVYAQTWTYIPFYRINPKKLRNEMKNVDFSQAQLDGISFSHQIDLSGCIFPEGEEYVFVSNREGVMNRAIEIINQSWKDPKERERGLGLVELLHSNPDMKGQKNAFIDSFVYTHIDKMAGDDVGMRVFTLIKQLQENHI